MEEVSQTTAKILHERQYMIDASIVKVMKRTRTILLQQLIEEVIKDLKLPIGVLSLIITIIIGLSYKALDRVFDK